MFKKNLNIFLTHSETETLEPWLEALSLTTQGKLLHVRFPHPYFGPWFTLNKKKEFEAAVHACFPDTFTDILYHESDEEDAAQTALVDKRTPSDRAGSKANEKATERSRQKSSFEDFFYNEKNSFSLNILIKIAQQSPGSIYTPILLCGPSGSGKTHLLKAVCKNFQRQGCNVFLSLHPSSLLNTTIFTQADLFWHEYSALFVDDIQELKEHSNLQRTLIHAMNTCPASCQIFLTLSGSVQNLAEFDERLKTRIESGLILDLVHPDIDVRMRFLQSLCSQERVQLNKKQMLFLAQRCTQYRHLQGTVLKISAISSVHKRPVNQADIDQVLNDGNIDKVIDYQEIMQQVAEKMKVSVEEILSTHRQNNLVLARQLAMYICRNRLGLSYPELGRIFGGKDHSTVIHAIRKIEHLLRTDTDMNNLVTQLTSGS